MSTASPPPLLATVPEVDVEAVRSELLTLLKQVKAAGPLETTAPGRLNEPATEPSPSSPSSIVSVGTEGPACGAPVGATLAEGTVPTCRQCGNLDSWGNASWCPKCGYYPALGYAGEVVPEEPAPLPQVAGKDLLPRWVIQIVLGLVLVAGLSAGLERYLVRHPGFLTLCSIMQLSFGAIIALLAHVQAILLGMRDPHAPDLKTMLANPFSVWRPVLKNLRERAYLLMMFSWGVWACVSAAMIYGPIRIAELQRELAELRHRRQQRSVMGAMVGTLAQDQASGGAPGVSGAGDEGDSDLGEALGDFTGVESADTAASAAGSAAPLPGQDQWVAAETRAPGSESPNVAEPSSGRTGLPQERDSPVSATSGSRERGGTHVADEVDGRSTLPQRTLDTAVRSPPRQTENLLPDRQRLEAVIFGYLASVEGEVRTLLLAAAGPDGRLRYVGKLTREALSASEWQVLSEELPTRRVSRPLVACPHHGHWVEPQTLLTIQFDRWSAAGFVNAQVTKISRRTSAGAQ